MDYLLYYFKRLQAFSGKKLYANLLGMVMVSFMQGMEIFLLIPLLSVSGIMGKSTNPISRFIVNYYPSVMKLSIILGIYLVLVIGQNLLQRNINRRNAVMHQTFTISLIQDIYRAVLQSNWGFFIKKRKSDIITSLTTEIGRINSGLSLFLQFLSSAIFTVIQVAIASWLSVKLTVFAIVCGFILVVLKRKFVFRAQTIGKMTTQLSKKYLACITDQLNGIKEIKSNTLEISRLRWLSSLTDEMIHEQNDYINLRTNSEFMSKVASAVLITVGIYLSVTILHAQSEQLLLVVLIFSRLWPRFADLQSNIEQIASNLPAFKALIELETECIESKELKNEELYSKHVKSINLKQGLECKNICFKYNQAESIYALQDINLQIPANRMTAIVGRSGAGKSTLIDILMGLVQPEKGQVLIDGTSLDSDNVLSLRRSISYVPQDPFLFNTSIRENLLLIEPEATDEEIWEALEFAAAAEFVRRLPKGLDTVIGDRGIKLSGGERQRLVLARAILRKPSILILDEATSALDTENETKIQEVLDSLKGTLTIIVVAHRMSTIRNADQVIVLDQGRVVQIGVFSQLAQEKRGLFSNLLGNQMEVTM